MAKNHWFPLLHLSFLMILLPQTYVLPLHDVDIDVRVSESWKDCGNGTVQNPYRIHDALDLQNISNDLSAHYILVNDINATETELWNNGSGFITIGNSTFGFNGSLDGRGFNITDLSIVNGYGMFNNIDPEGEISNISFRNSALLLYANPEIIVGHNMGSISNISSTNAMITKENDGIIIDSNSYYEDYYSASFNGLMSKKNGPQGVITRSSTSGRVTGWSIGGLVMDNYGLISDCSSSLDITNTRSDVGGLVSVNYGIVQNSFYNGTLIGRISTGGISGVNYGTIEACDIELDSTSASGIVGDNHGSIYDCTVEGTMRSPNGVGGSSIGGIAGENFNGGTIERCDMKGIVDCGGIVGENHAGAFVVQCTMRGIVNGSGGIAASNSGTISNSSVSGNITGQGNYKAGIVGRNVEEGSIHSCDFQGRIDGSDYLGGIAGYNDGIIQYSSSTCTISGGSYIGGISGECGPDGSVLRSRSNSSIEGDYCVGGLIGYHFGSIMDSFFEGGVKGPKFVGGIVGFGEYFTNIVNSHYNVVSVLINGRNSLSRGGLYGLQYIDWLTNDLSLKIEDYNSTLVFNGNTYEINDVQGLKDLLGFCENEEVEFVLGSDIDLKDTESFYIPYFSARSFDGDYHNITNLTLDRKNAMDLGLFGCNDGGTIRNLYLWDVNIKGFNYIGGLVGMNAPYSNIINVSVSGKIRGQGQCIGGISGANMGYINNSCSMGSLEGDSRIGGIAGMNQRSGIISNSNSGCAITGFARLGGLVGENLQKASISNSYSIGAISQSSYFFGGLAGVNSGDVKGSFWDKETSRCNDSSGGSGKTTFEMMSRSTFSDAGWDLRNIWGIYQGITYPYLLWQERAPPIANAGPDIIADEDTQVSFDGTASHDDHAIAIFKWSFIEGEKNVELFGPVPSYTFFSPGEYTIILNVSDFSGKWDLDTLLITVLDITRPKAEAGTDLIINEDTTVTLDGTKSTDNIGIVSYLWSIIDQNNVIELDGPTYPINFSEPGHYSVQLKVTDGVGLFDIDGFSVLVRDITPPKADAGDDRSIVLGDRVEFDGSMSWDNVGIENYTWTIQMNEEMISLFGVSSNYLFHDWGTFKVTLTVKDPSGLISVDSMYVRTMDLIDPIVDAGTDLIVYEDVPVTLNGNGSSDNVGIENYTWSINGRDTNLLFGVTPSHIFNDPGTYTIILIVTDLEGLFSKDTLIVTVLDRTPPVADAGIDIYHNEDTELLFDGGNSTDNVWIDRYQWSIKDGPDITHYDGRYIRYTFYDPGLFSVILTVTDASNLSDTDEIVVRILDRTAPKAQAGPDIEIDVGDAVHFNGSGSMDNGVITEYKWNIEIEDVTTVISGKDITYEFKDPGTYTVTLIVVDSGGNTDEDTMIVTVHGPTPSDWPLVLFIGIVLISMMSIGILIVRRSGSRRGKIEE